MPRQMYSKFIFLFYIRYVRNRIDHWCTVEPGNSNPRVHRSSWKLGEASFPTGTVDPRVGISLPPLNTNDGFSLSGMQEIIVYVLFNLKRLELPNQDMGTQSVTLHIAMAFKI